MRLGGPLFDDIDSPEKWIAALRKLNYRTAFCPVDATADDTTVRSYSIAAERNDIVIAEIGAWSNPISPDEEERSRSLASCQEQLALADRIAARCCVNISGSRGTLWDGPDSDNLTDSTFDMIVEMVRTIIDAVKPIRTYYTLETMPWMYPDSVDSYERLLKAIDRKSFAVHFDPVNLIYSPQHYYQSGKLIANFVSRLGSHIRSCHAKDILLDSKLTVHLDEIRPGLGGLDYRTYLTEIDKLHPNIPLLLEHLPLAEEYDLAADYVRSVAKEQAIQL